MLGPDRVAAYLGRIGLDGPPRPDLDGLTSLQGAHMRSVPFENLDILIGRPLSLGVDDLFDKIVVRRRGGYCFELNTLYAELLRAVGFQPIPVMGRVWLRDPPATPPRTHLAHRVEIDGTNWLTDVGFGGQASHVPVPLDGSKVPDPDGDMRVVPDPDFGHRVQRRLHGSPDWQDQFTFEAAPAHASDVTLGNHYTETHPDSHFRHGVGVGLFREVGRVGLYGNTLTRRGAGSVTTEPVAGLEATLDVLDAEFGLRPDPSPEETARLRRILDMTGR